LNIFFPLGIIIIIIMVMDEQIFFGSTTYSSLCPVLQVTNGSMMTRVVGPHADAAGKYWIIDGRDEEVPAGTVARSR
jgi:hypothetical protein